MNNAQEKIELIEQRNRRVELDKTWETSFVRRGFIACVTYAIAVWFMWSIGVEDAISECTCANWRVFFCLRHHCLY